MSYRTPRGEVRAPAPDEGEEPMSYKCLIAAAVAALPAAAQAQGAAPVADSGEPVTVRPAAAAAAAAAE